MRLDFDEWRYRFNERSVIDERWGPNMFVNTDGKDPASEFFESFGGRDIDRTYVA